MVRLNTPVADLECGHTRSMLPAETGWESYGFCSMCHYRYDPLIRELKWIHTQWWIFQW